MAIKTPISGREKNAASGQQNSVKRKRSYSPRVAKKAREARKREGSSSGKGGGRIEHEGHLLNKRKRIFGRDDKPTRKSPRGEPQFFEGKKDKLNGGGDPECGGGGYILQSEVKDSDT